MTEDIENPVTMRVVRQYVIDDDWMPLRPDMIETALAWGMPVKIGNLVLQADPE